MVGGIVVVKDSSNDLKTWGHNPALDGLHWEVLQRLGGVCFVDVGESLWGGWHEVGVPRWGYRAWWVDKVGYQGALFYFSAAGDLLGEVLDRWFAHFVTGIVVVVLGLCHNRDHTYPYSSYPDLSTPIPSHQNNPRAPNVTPEPSDSIPSQLVSQQHTPEHSDSLASS